jgi:hypothetical protein
MSSEDYDTISIPESIHEDSIVSGDNSQNKLNEHLIHPNVKIKGILKYPVPDTGENTIKRIVKFCAGFIVCIIILIVVVIFFI